MKPSFNFKNQNQSAAQRAQEGTRISHQQNWQNSIHPEMRLKVRETVRHFYCIRQGHPAKAVLAAVYENTPVSKLHGHRPCSAGNLASGFPALAKMAGG
jgi:hypothetical protein